MSLELPSAAASLVSHLLPSESAGELSTSLLVEYKNRGVRIARRTDYEELLQSVRFHIPDILAEEGIELYTNDLPTGRGEWVELSAPYWPYVRATTHVLKLNLRKSNKFACGEYFINVELPVLGRTLSVAVKASTPIGQILMDVAARVGRELSSDDHHFLFNGVSVPMDETLANWDIECNDTVVLLAGKGPGLHTDCSASVRRFQLNVSTKAGKTIALMATHDTKIDKLKQDLEAKLGVSASEQVVTFNGSRLDDARTLVEVGITTRASIEMFAAQRAVTPVRMCGRD